MGQGNKEQENKEQKKQSDNIWDRIFKIILQEMPQMVLPLINEVFHEGYGMDTEIVPLNNEFYNADGSKVVSDTSFLVDRMLYHFECQFSNDKEMAFRMFEYDFHIGLSGTQGENRIDEFVFPRSSVVYITTNKNIPKKLNLKIIFPNGEFMYEVPAVRVHDYSLESISQKKLLIFLPYLALRYSQKLKNKNRPTKAEIKQFYSEMINVLTSAYNNNIIGQWHYNLLLEMIKEVEGRVFHDYPEIKKGGRFYGSKPFKFGNPTIEEKNGTAATGNGTAEAGIRTAEDEGAEQAAKQAEQATKQAVFYGAEVMKKFGITLTEEQIQEMLKYAMEQQKIAE